MRRGAKLPLWLRQFALLLLLCAFSAESCFAAVHIHGAGTTATAASHAHKAPANNKDDPDDCPLCQAAALAGAFITPAIVVLPMAVRVTDAAPPAFPSTTLHTSERTGWQSRAPPRA